MLRIRMNIKQTPAFTLKENWTKLTNTEPINSYSTASKSLNLKIHPKANKIVAWAVQSSGSCSPVL